MRLNPTPALGRLEPMRSGPPGALVVIVVLAAAALAAFYWVPRHAAWSPSSWARADHAAPAATPAGVAASSAAASGADEDALRAQRAEYDRRQAALEARGAQSWGGADFATATGRAAESVGAHDAGNLALARQRLTEASQLLDAVERAAPAGQARSQRLTGVLPLIADAQSAQAAHQYSRAAQDYTQALQLDPKNAQARTGLVQAQAAVGDDNYARAAGEGFAALGAGRLAEARAAFERARSIRPGGPEALDGLKRVNAADGGRNSASHPVSAAAGSSVVNTGAAAPSSSVDSIASVRTHAEQLEAQERWDEAAALYAAALREDDSLAFAQAGRARAAARARLDHSLQALLDHPDRLAILEVRDQASALLDTAQATTPSGPVLRSQIARLQILLPDFDKPVRVFLVSDGVTQVAILSVGSFGSFERRDIELRPGTYTVLGSRVGYRDVHHEITIAPGETQTVSISCYEPI
jgi:tetratricopeptide (TPR) repeat protein